MPFKNAIRITQKSPRGSFSSVVCEITTIIIIRIIIQSFSALVGRGLLGGGGGGGGGRGLLGGGGLGTAEGLHALV